MAFDKNGYAQPARAETPSDFDWDEAFGRLATYERQAGWENFVARFKNQAAVKGRTRNGG